MAGDIYYAKRILGLHCNGANAGTTFTDNSPTPKTITANGNAQTSTTQSKFNGSSGKFDGTTDYLSTPDHADFALGTNDLTISAWVYLNAVPAENKVIINQRDGTGATNYAFSFQINATTMTLNFGYSVDGTTTVGTSSTTALTTGAWIHVAYTRCGNTGRFFINGVVDATTTAFNGASIFNSTAAVFIGARGADAALSLDGYIADLLMYNGVAIYTKTFTAPTATFDDSAETQSTWENEVSKDAPTLRYGFGDPSGTTCVAGVGGASMNGTYSGGFTLQQANIIYRAADKATAFIRASSGWVSWASQTLIGHLAGATELTIEMVFKCNGNTANSQQLLTFLRAYNAGESWNYLCNIDYAPGGNGIGATMGWDTANTTANSHNSTNLVAGNTYHIAVVLSGASTAKTVTLYVNGVAQTPGTFTSAGAPLVAGTFGAARADAVASSQAGGGPFLDGTIDDLVVYKSALSGARVAAHYSAMRCRDLTFNKLAHKPARSVQIPIHHRGI